MGRPLILRVDESKYKKYGGEDSSSDDSTANGTKGRYKINSDLLMYVYYPSVSLIELERSRRLENWWLPTEEREKARGY